MQMKNLIKKRQFLEYKEGLCCKKIIWHSETVNVFSLDEVKQRAHKTAQRLKSLPHQYADLF